jgi:plasmid maintenance system antidote protein VapI
MKTKTKLKTWMDENGYSNSRLAQELGLGYDLIYKLAVTGDRKMTNDFKWRFSERFGRDEAAKVVEVNQQPQAEISL